LEINTVYEGEAIMKINFDGTPYAEGYFRDYIAINDKRKQIPDSFSSEEYSK
jgi:hypothetical protein